MQWPRRLLSSSIHRGGRGGGHFLKNPDEFFEFRRKFKFATLSLAPYAVAAREHYSREECGAACKEIWRYVYATNVSFTSQPLRAKQRVLFPHAYHILLRGYTVSGGHESSHSQADSRAKGEVSKADIRMGDENGYPGRSTQLSLPRLVNVFAIGRLVATVNALAWR